MIIYTNAPAAYDYGYVTELDPDVGNFSSGMDKDNPVRKLNIEANEAVIQGQRNRYSSGLYPSLEQWQMDEWTEDGLFIPRGGGDEKSNASEAEEFPTPLDAHCAHCSAAARIDELGTTCRSCGRGIIVTETTTDGEEPDELDYISGIEPGTWCEDDSLKGE